MQKNDESIRNICVASIKRHTIRPIDYPLTKVFESQVLADIDNKISSAFRHLENELPIQMTFEGRNFDVLAGLTAVVVAFLLQRKIIGKRFIYVWNIFSLILLTNIVTIAILSTPVPFRVFMNEPANTIVTTFPFVWLPALLVPMAYGLNVLSFVQWRSRN